ncbi:MAG: trypsin-like serine protease [Polyangiaceae bacterium]|nr:trypsin-like serine protease [Polyangiaceae bacterium]
MVAPIAYGTTDVGNLWPEVGQLQLAGGLCTATLVTPRYVLSASHCFTTTSIWNRNASVVFDMGVAPLRQRQGVGFS